MTNDDIMILVDEVISTKKNDKMDESKPDVWQNTWKGNCSVEPIWGYTGGN